MKLSTADLSFRRESWNEIRRIITDPNKTDSQKLEECMNVSNVYAAVTGDDSLTHPKIKKYRDVLIASIDDACRAARASEIEKQRGQKSLF